MAPQAETCITNSTGWGSFCSHSYIPWCVLESQLVSLHKMDPFMDSHFIKCPCMMKHVISTHWNFFTGHMHLRMDICIYRWQQGWLLPCFILCLNACAVFDACWIAVAVFFCTFKAFELSPLKVSSCCHFWAVTTHWGVLASMHVFSWSKLFELIVQSVG